MPETAFEPGDPVCSVHAAAATGARALALLRRRSAFVQRALERVA
jgi:predicted ATP-grasp superfamily ATP-dependent carboligase